MLPVEVLHRIAAESPQSYRALLSLPPFARSLSPGIIAEYKIHFGHEIKIDRDCVQWCYRGVVHRLDGPAVEFIDSAEDWYSLHPYGARQGSSKITGKLWYQNGTLHRLDGPAVEYPDGGYCWYKNGHLHRDDGPAIKYANGSNEWYRDGERHRLWGPALEYKEIGCRAWYLYGRKIYSRCDGSPGCVIV